MQTPGIEQQHYASWRMFKADGLTNLFEGGYFRRGLYLFRGQMSADWNLVSSFDRWFEKMGRDRRERIETAERLLEHFKLGCEELDIYPELRDDPERLAVLAQHYGLPTRLLDWSESIYIAAFFAFCEAISEGSMNGSVAIWALNLRSSAWQREMGASIVAVPAGGNQRLRNQLGKFTHLRTPDASLEEYVGHILGNQAHEEEVALYQLIIPAGEAKTALADIDAMGISHARIFPEAVGCAMSAKMRILLGS